MLEKIQHRFTESIQTQIASADLLSAKLAEAATRLAECLLRGNKIIVCGFGRSYLNAQLLVSHLLHRYELDRPSFGAVLLHLDSLLTSLYAQEQMLGQLYQKQLQSLTQTGDIFVIFSPFGEEEIVLNAIQLANTKELEILAFTSSQNEHTRSLLDENDIELEIPSDNELRILEGHQFCLNLLCELIDHHIFLNQDKD